MKKLISILLVAVIVITLPVFAFASETTVEEDTPEIKINVKPTLGIKVEEGEKIGAGITSLESGSLAEKLGMQEGDVIVAVGGVKVKSTNAFGKAWESYSTGNKIEFELLRRGRKFSVDVTKGSGKLGITLADYPIGAIVKEIEAENIKARTDIAEGDILVGLNERPVVRQLSIEHILEDCYVGQVVDLEYLHDDELIIEEVKLGAGGFGISEIEIVTPEVKASESAPLMRVYASGDLEAKPSMSWIVEERGTDFWVGQYEKDEKNGLLIERTYDEDTGIYTSTLWADSIPRASNGLKVYCVVQDKTRGMLKTEEATIVVR